MFTPKQQAVHEQHASIWNEGNITNKSSNDPNV